MPWSWSAPRAWQGERRRKYAEPWRIVRLRRSTNEVCRVSASSDSHRAAFSRLRRADPPAPFDSDDAIVPPSLEHLTRDARRPQEALTHPTVVLEPIGRDQRESPHASAED